MCRDGERAGVPQAPCCRCGRAFKDGDRGVLLPFAGGPGDPPELGYHVECLAAAMGLGTIHVLQSGRALCGMEGVPSDWAPGHRWVRVEEADEATCGSCRDAAGTRGAQRGPAPSRAAGPTAHWRGPDRGGLRSSACGMVRGGTDGQYAVKLEEVTCGRCRRTSEFVSEQRARARS